MNGYHVFYHNKIEDDQFETINYLVQVASALFWKKNHGEIHLYCNSNFLKFIQKWKIESIYDSINTEVLDNAPIKEYIEKYWSFCKIEAAKDIVKTHKEFVIIDTDLWIHDEINLDNSYSFIGYHPEMMMNHSSNPYLSPDIFLKKSDVLLFDWTISPINCAFIYLNSEDLVNQWYTWSLYIINNNKDLKKHEMSADTIFIEQRLLPTLTHSLNLKVGSLIPNMYLPHIPSDQFGSEWSPKIGFDEFNQYMTWNIKHVWGLKKYYSDPNIRNMVIELVTNSLDSYFDNWNVDFILLLDDIKNNITLSLAY
jgi:hypothetical protein